MPIALALWLGATGQSHSDSDSRQRRVVRSALTRLIRSVSSLLARFGALVNALPGTLKTSMAPKPIRNSGDKGEGAREVRIGKYKGDIALVGRRPASTIMKPSGKPAAGSEQLTCEVDAIHTTLVVESLDHMVPKEVEVVKKDGMSLKAPDWAKDGGDKFYSLMEESDFTSSEHNQSKSGSSILSETGSIPSTTEPTVRQQRRHCKCVRIWSGLSAGTELSATSSSKTLKWDYAGIKLTETPFTDGQLKADRSIVLVSLVQSQGYYRQYMTRLRSCKQRLDQRTAEHGLPLSASKALSIRL
ncbi:hypothetical protein NDU88_001094 [Pleurodeles waltl]|uniref:Uncharacterized protein n=1 Tax=Pleurodeles waltl TaxID=8319 RepID=A0AAV7P4D9_PLEWA|nr:hypothetical protein NDU88_001094 [Pleurodeles waltl]